MKKGFLLTLLLATTTLFVACGSTPTQDTTDTPNAQDTQSTVGEVQEPVEEYISLEERNTTMYKPYFEMTGFLYGSQDDTLDDDLAFEAYKERTVQGKSLLVNFTSSDGTRGAIRINGEKNREKWHFDSIRIMNSGIIYVPSNADYFEEFAFAMFDFSTLSGNMMVNQCTSDEYINAFTSWLPLPSSSHYHKPCDVPEYTIDIGDTYAKIIYRTDYEYPFKYEDGYEHVYSCTGYTLVYDDYQNQKRYIVTYGKNLNDTKDTLNFMNSIEIISEEERSSQNHFYWTFPEGMEGYTGKLPFNNGMSRNITSYTTPDNHEMLFHWYGPEMLGAQVYVTNDVLTLCEGEGKYKLNAQAILASDIADKFDVSSYGLMEHEHFATDGHVDDYGTQILYPITDDNGYKGYATLLYGSDYPMPNDYVYFFTYVERDDIYNDERALEVMASLDYHFK